MVVRHRFVESLVNRSALKFTPLSSSFRCCGRARTGKHFHPAKNSASGIDETRLLSWKILFLKVQNRVVKSIARYSRHHATGKTAFCPAVGCRNEVQQRDHRLLVFYPV